MKILKNQTIYQCEYCGKRFISKNGAKMHEEIYCEQSSKRLEKIKNCDHEMVTEWEPIPGEEWRYQPSYEYCIKCGATDLELIDSEMGEGVS